MGHPPQAVWLPGRGLAHLAPAVERIRAYHGTTPDELAVVLRARPRGTEVGQLAAIAWVLDAARSQVLLVDHRQHGWSCPGGHVETREEPAATAARELSEETGLRVDPGDLTQLGAYGAPDRDPRGRTISVAHVLRLDSAAAVKGDDDASDAQWVEVGQALDDGLAFDHEQIVRDALVSTT